MRNIQPVDKFFPQLYQDRKNILKIAISTSSFASLDTAPLEFLKSKGLKVIHNPYGRKLNESEIIDLLQDVDGLLAGVEPLNSRVFQECPKLKTISRLGVGLDNLDLGAAIQSNIKVFKTETTPAPAVAELVLGLTIDVSRKISKSNQLLQNGIWKKEMGLLLQRKTLGIIGLGIIGKALA